MEQSKKIYELIEVVIKFMKDPTISYSDKRAAAMTVSFESVRMSANNLQEGLGMLETIKDVYKESTLNKNLINPFEMKIIQINN